MIPSHLHINTCIKNIFNILIFFKQELEVWEDSTFHDGHNKKFSLQIGILIFSRHCNRLRAKEQILFEFSVHRFMFFGFILKDFPSSLLNVAYKHFLMFNTTMYFLFLADMYMEFEALTLYCKTDKDCHKPQIVKELDCPTKQPPVCFNNECACDPNPPKQIVW